MTETRSLSEAALATILEPAAADSQHAFQDSDGLISFVNLSSSFVQNNPEFKVGQAVCDKLSNFIATLRAKTFLAIQSGKLPPLPGDPKPKTQWDKAVTHRMFNILTEANGLTNFKITSETYSITQVMTEFSTAFVKLIFDAAFVPEAVITDVTNFLQGVGKSLRFSWDDKTRTYSTTLLGQCHEAVPMDTSGKDYRYFPKVKYYSINVSSHQTEFTTPCSDTKTITFNFQYEYYVTALAQSVLNTETETYKKFNAILDKAQEVSYKDADNNLDTILGGSASNALESPRNEPSVNVFGANLSEYPAVAITPPSTIETILNTR